MKKSLKSSLTLMLVSSMTLATTTPVLAITAEQDPASTTNEATPLTNNSEMLLDSSLELTKEPSTDSEMDMNTDNPSDESLEFSEEATIAETTDSNEATSLEDNSNLTTTDSTTSSSDETTVTGLTIAKEKATQQFVTITNNNTIIWSEKIEEQALANTADVYLQTFLSKDIKTINGKNYYSLYTQKDEKEMFYGYVSESALQQADGRQGIYQSYGKYVTITSNNYSIYSNFSWSVKNSTKNIYQKTYLAKGKYQHYNGLTYLSLYDNNGTWMGYVNANATKVADGRQGLYQSFGKYVTVTSNNYSLYSNFSWTVKNSTKNIYQQTYLAKGKYQHYNGLTYLSLYHINGKWMGYVNANATKAGEGRQGAYLAYNKYVTVTNANYTTYRNFSWKNLGTTKNMNLKTYLAKGKYVHTNGMTYLSLWDDKGTWYGYVNANAVSVADGAQGIYQSFNRYITITSPNYSMWNSFNWSLRQTSAKLNKKGFIAKGKYVHYNGAIYYSVYDALGNWQGYINATGTSLVTYKALPANYYSQMAIGAWYGCAATSLYTVLKAKGYVPNVSLVNFINGLPVSNSNPDEGQIGDPWGKTPFRQVISPVGLNKYARKYTNNTEIITGSSIDRIITEINSGNYVLYWGTYKMGNVGITNNPQHCMIARGYKIVNGKEYILIHDPGYNSLTGDAVRWYEKNAFDNYLTSKYRKLLVIR
ncbi:C39 family peptidase [Vagococcus zengguangii]|uniref:Peptidase C39-like domain-containing protein n=1 Tax=Vagococcus zengguangii TaxID=2571750 RepID=A0A4D7CUS8_9ENTE|nr:C39 family peptidase [Vagococcus zengguangii]QCI87034.1 hypothetical protein FA707_08675 [Vagococcus zengguangii]